ncbi:MAG: 30S ribosomal protein S6 [Candidatus Omnitrophota bacterium]
MQAYEAMFILKPSLQEEEQKELIGKVEGVLKEQKAEGVNIQLFGRRQLGYEINHCKEGTYYLVNFSALDKTIPAKLKHFVVLNEKILRVLIVKKIKPAPKNTDTGKVVKQKTETGEGVTQESVND